MTVLPMDTFTNVHGIDVALIDANQYVAMQSNDLRKNCSFDLVVPVQICFYFDFQMEN